MYYGAKLIKNQLVLCKGKKKNSGEGEPVKK